jgi:hypothetical protein
MSNLAAHEGRERKVKQMGDSKTIRIGDLVAGDRIRFPDSGPDESETVYTISQIHKPGHGDCYVEFMYPDGGRYRSAEHESSEVELVERGTQTLSN